jgi:DNA-directed RNA polymerase specialized sigma24 family protein
VASIEVDLAGLLATLPPEQHEALVARVVHEREYGEIADRLRCSELVVRKRVSRALSALRARLPSNPEETLT